LSFLKIFVTLFHFNRTNWKAVALCFLAATVFWLFNALNKTYSTHIRFPLKFQYDETRFANATELPKDLLINVNGNGWDLFRKTFGVKLPVLSIALERPTEVKKIVAATLPPMLAGQLGSLSINFVAVDTLRLHIDNRIVRKFKLSADASAISFRGSLGRTSPIVLLPDSVELIGPESILRTWSDSILVKLPAKRISTLYREEVEVLLPRTEFIKRNPPVVEARFEVKEMTEITRKLKVTTAALPWGMVIENDSVNCRLLIPSESAEHFDLSKLTVVPSVSLVSLGKGESTGYASRVVGLPPYTHILQIDSIRMRQH
jgi:hypothetical protein